MKKILFNDKFLLTQAVLEGRKTQTRRIITHPKTFHGKDVCGFYVCRRATDGAVTEVCMYDENESSIDEGQILPKYKVGEVVAVAQSYKDLRYQPTDKTSIIRGSKIEFIEFQEHKGWTNKMFVDPNLMLHEIRITNVRIERLQDISDDDCLEEGIMKGRCGSADNHFMDAYYVPNEIQPYCTPKDAYAVLIDKVGKKGDWDRNPYVFVYDFELVK